MIESDQSDESEEAIENRNYIVSLTDHKLISMAIDEAQKSPVLMRHGCVASRNGKIIARGFNHYRTFSRDSIINNTCTCHAECDVVHKLLNSGVSDFRKIVFYIVRINKKNETKQSGPCIDCYNTLVKCGVRKIVYTTDEGVIKTNLTNYKATQITSGRAFLDRNTFIA